ncbi:cupin domain-containing protein [Actinoplanes sp. NPDC051411]|uniref:cupin domain-containing protein n=1 Tax=Actinoplanes sp. NPDC051411 TaxID=3155522 RepID=UPI0034192606
MEKWSLTALADGLLSHALGASDRSGVRTVCDGRSGLLYQTVIALAHGQRLEQHDNPGDATVQVLRGRVRITAGDDTTEGSPGQLLIMPGARRTVVALEDTVLLLTAANRTTPIAAGLGNTSLRRSIPAATRLPTSARNGTSARAANDLITTAHRREPSR